MKHNTQPHLLCVKKLNYFTNDAHAYSPVVAVTAADILNSMQQTQTS
jgi:hypothetical protein